LSRLVRGNGRARVCVCVTGNVYPIDSMRCDGCSVVGASRNPRNSSISFHFASPRLVSSKCPRILCLVTEHVPHSLAFCLLPACFLSPLSTCVFSPSILSLRIHSSSAQYDRMCAFPCAWTSHGVTNPRQCNVCVCMHQLRHTQTNSTHRGNQTRRIFRTLFLPVCVSDFHTQLFVTREKVWKPSHTLVTCCNSK